MSHAIHRPDDESTPPIVLSKHSRFRSDFATLIAIVISVAIAVNYWNNFQHKAQDTQTAVDGHTQQLTVLQTNVTSLTKDVQAISATQASQLEIIKYIARDRRGPVPEELKKQ